MKLLIFFFSLFVSISASCQSWNEITKHFASNQQADDNFGCAVAVDDEYANVGAWHHDLDGAGGNTLSNAGAAYIFKYNSSTKKWEEEAKLLAADRELNDAFGISVDISGTFAVIGAVEHDAARGAAYVFERNSAGTWVQVAKLEAPIKQASDRFGNAVAISDSFVVVGAYHEDEDTTESNTIMNAGSAYIYQRTSSGWNFYQKIVASNRDLNDYFGFDVDIDENKIIVGAYNADPDTAFVLTGMAYAYELQAGLWTEVKKLGAITLRDGDRFGWSVAVNENYFAVGAPYHGYIISGVGTKLNAGAVYVFDASNSWAAYRMLQGDAIDQDNFGNDVAVEDDLILVGCAYQDYDTSGAPPYFGNGGAAYIFEKESTGITWFEKQKLLATDRFSGDQFGYAVDISGEDIFIGAIEDNQDTGTVKASVGAVYYFGLNSGIGINQFNKEEFLSVYPNPFLNELTISPSNHFIEGEIRIYNALGAETYFQRIEQKTTINASGWPPGVYKIVFRSNGISNTMKLIKSTQP